VASGAVCIRGSIRTAASDRRGIRKCHVNQRRPVLTRKIKREKRKREREKERNNDRTTEIMILHTEKKKRKEKEKGKDKRLSALLFARSLPTAFPLRLSSARSALRSPPTSHVRVRGTARTARAYALRTRNRDYRMTIDKPTIEPGRKNPSPHRISPLQPGELRLATGLLLRARDLSGSLAGFRAGGGRRGRGEGSRSGGASQPASQPA